MNVIVYNDVKDPELEKSLFMTKIHRYADLVIKKGMIMKNRWGNIGHVYESSIVETANEIVIRIKKFSDEDEIEWNKDEM